MDKLITNLVGIDEVGVGCLAGPMMLAAVCLPKGFDDAAIRDSKKVNSNNMASLVAKIKDVAIWWGCLKVSVARIDSLGTWESWERGVCKLATDATKAVGAIPIVLDGTRRPRKAPKHLSPLKGGDAINYAVAAASIIAKCYRDRYMKDLAQHYPAYGFATNVGYPTKVHKDALIKFGPTPHHRAAASRTCRVNALRKTNGLA